MKGRTKKLILALLFVPGVVLVMVGVSIAIHGRLSIPDAEVAEGTVKRVYTRRTADIEGSVTRDWVSVAFVSNGGRSASFEAEVFSTAFLGVGNKVKVWYEPRNPERARLSGGFFAEPYAVVFLIFFGGFWLALPMGIVFLFMRFRSA